MRVKLTVLVASALFIVMCAQRASAESRWSNTTGGSFDWNTSGDWQGTFPPGATDDVRITNDLGSAQVITNMGLPSSSNPYTINFLAVSNGLGNASITVVQSPRMTWQTTFGLQLGKNATLILTTNAFIGTNTSSTLTFDLRPGGGAAGTLVLSNASPTSGFSTFINNGNSAPINNSGTILFNPNGNQLVSLNYGQTTLLTNNALGTVVMNGTGTGAFVGNFGSNNERLLNNGSIFVQAGTLRIDSRNAFSGGGFQNTATGFVQVNTGGTFELRRTTNAWTAGTAVTNLGTVFMNGGTMLAFDTDQNGNLLTNALNQVTTTTNTTRVFQNLGLIKGRGAILASLNNLSGSTLAPGFGTFQTLNVGGAVTMGSNSILSIDLGSLAGQNDLLAVGSNLTLNANSILDLSGGAVGNVYTVATAFAVSGVFSSVTPDYTVTYNPTDIAVQFVPEPSTLLLAAMGLTSVFMLRRRKS